MRDMLQRNPSLHHSIKTAATIQNQPVQCLYVRVCRGAAQILSSVRCRLEEAGRLAFKSRAGCGAAARRIAGRRIAVILISR